MKTSYLHSVIMLALLVAMPMSAATFQWAYVIGTSATPIEVYVDQVVADGSGGCVVVWNERNNDTVHTRVFLLRLDKKGVVVWMNNTIETEDIELGMVDKNNVVASITPESGDERTMIVDKKGGMTMLAEAGADVSCDMNSEIGPTGDKKGFFVVVTGASGDVVLQRYSFK
jgi:hypothetical protein